MMDDEYDPYVHDKPDDLGPDDEDDDSFAMSVYDPVFGWLDAS